MENEFVPHEDPTFTPIAPPVLIPPHERPEAPLLHMGFARLFWLGIASILVNLLSNSLRLGERIPALRVPLVLASFVVGALMIAVLWRMADAVPRFRKAALWNIVSVAASPLLAWIDLSDMTGSLGETDIGAVSAALIALLAVVLGVDIAARYQEFTACAEAFNGSDEIFAGKWLVLRTWTVVLVVLFGACLVLMLMLTVSQGMYYIVFGSTSLLLVAAAAAVGMAVLSVMELVYLYRAASLFA